MKVTSKDDVERDLQTVRALAVSRLMDVAMGLMGYGLDREKQQPCSKP